MRPAQKFQFAPADFKLLRIFRVIVESGGFAAAQGELNVSAAKISNSMTALESRLGFRLCDRGRMGFRLTDEGRRTYDATTKLEDAVGNFRSQIGEIKGQLVGNLVIGLVDATITNPVSKISQALSNFRVRAPSIDIEIRIQEPTVIEKGILESRFDLGISAFYYHLPGITYERLFHEDHALYCHRTHPFFKRKPDTVSLEEVLEADYVMRGYMGNMRNTPASAMKAAATCYDMEAALILVQTGRFIGHLPVHYADDWVRSGQLKSVLANQLSFRANFEVAVRRGAKPRKALKILLDELRAAHTSAP